MEIVLCLILASVATLNLAKSQGISLKWVRLGLIYTQRFDVAE
jgi:hypothetical protein